MVIGLVLQFVMLLNVNPLWLWSRKPNQCLLHISSLLQGYLGVCFTDPVIFDQLCQVRLFNSKGLCYWFLIFRETICQKLINWRSLLSFLQNSQIVLTVTFQERTLVEFKKHNVLHENFLHDLSNVVDNYCLLFNG